MEAIYWGSGCGGGVGKGPWVHADLEDGCWGGNGTVNPNPANLPIEAAFVTAMVKGDSGNRFALKGGDAQKTDGQQMSRALLLSRKAEADAKPELELYADDVICAHGATVGELDATQLFYLTSRGIPYEIARSMLIEAFLIDTIETIENETLAGLLRPVAEAWLACGEAS